MCQAVGLWYIHPLLPVAYKGSCRFCSLYTVYCWPAFVTSLTFDLFCLPPLQQNSPSLLTSRTENPGTQPRACSCNTLPSSIAQLRSSICSATDCCTHDVSIVSLPSVPSARPCGSRLVVYWGHHNPALLTHIWIHSRASLPQAPLPQAQCMASRGPKCMQLAGALSLALTKPHFFLLSHADMPAACSRVPLAAHLSDCWNLPHHQRLPYCCP